MKDFPNPPSDERDHAALHTAIRAFADLRASLHQRALDLSTEYAERREAMGHGFANLNLQVQKHNDGRTITLYWGLLHFRKGKKTGFTLDNGLRDRSCTPRLIPRWAPRRAALRERTQR